MIDYLYSVEVPPPPPRRTGRLDTDLFLSQHVHVQLKYESFDTEDAV